MNTPALENARAKWTADHDEKLRLLWTAIPLYQIAKRLGRTECAVRARAITLGLPLGVARGYESFATAARRSGYEHITLKRAVRWCERRGERVDWSALPAVRPTRRRGQWRQIDPDEADAVARAYSTSELASQASQRLGVPPWTLRRRAILLGHKVPPEKHLRLLPHEWDEAAKGYRKPLKEEMP